MKEQIIYNDEYTKIVLDLENDEKELEPSELMSILDEDDIHRIEQNRILGKMGAIKQKEIYHIE